MKVILLAGGFGTRLSEYTDSIPKPMVQIGDKPMLWHIMSIYAKYNYKDFVIAAGYKSEVIKEYFSKNTKDWNVELVETGKNTMTGGRVKRLQKIIGNETCMLTYGDGVADINIKELLKFHKSHGKLLTMTSAQPDGRFGALDIDDDNKVNEFKEKPKGDGSWINAGYFVCEPKVLEFITEGDATIFEQSEFLILSKNGSLSVQYPAS